MMSRVSHADAFPWWRFLSPRHWPTWIGLGLLRMVVLLPFPVQLALGRITGRLVMLAWGSRRHAAAVNLRLCMPELDEAARTRLVREHFEALGIGLVEAGLCWWSRDGWLRERVTVKGLEYLEQARSEGTPVILLSAHTTTLEIGGRLLGLFAKFHLMYRPSPDLLLDEVVRRNRERHFDKAISRDSVKEMLESLKSGQPVWYAPDQNFRNKGAVTVPFFGNPASTNPATSRLARITGARVIPYAVRRLPGTAGYTIELDEPLANFPTDDVEADTARVNGVIEAMIRRAPEQYLWIHRRFKRRTKRDPSLPDPYDR